MFWTTIVPVRYHKSVCSSLFLGPVSPAFVAFMIDLSDQQGTLPVFWIKAPEVCFEGSPKRQGFVGEGGGGGRIRKVV